MNVQALLEDLDDTELISLTEAYEVFTGLEPVLYTLEDGIAEQRLTESRSTCRSFQGPYPNASGEAPPVSQFSGEDLECQLDHCLPSLERARIWNDC